MTLLRIAVAAVGVLLALDVDARAGTVSYSQPFITFTGDAGVNTVTVTRSSPTVVTFRDTTGSTTVDADATGVCTQASDTVTCTFGSSPFVTATGGANDDELTAAGPGGDVTLLGGPDSDVLTGGPGDDELNGGLGDDDLDGGGGNDSLDGGGPSTGGSTGSDGDDILDGGAGEDLVGMYGADIVRDTGPVTTDLSDPSATKDTLDLHYITAGAEVSVNAGSADDGEVGTLGGDVQLGFEVLLGTEAADVLTGSEAVEDLRGYGGEDEIDGLGGVDEYSGGLENDTLTTRDGLAEDQIYCEGGTDTVTADASDTVDASCETTVVPTPSPSPEPSASPSPEPSASASPSPAPGASTSPGPGPAVVPSFPFPITATAETTRTSTVPDVVDKPVQKARGALDAAIPNVDVVINFSRRCKSKQTLDVLKQNPLAGATVKTSENAVQRVALDVCDGGKDFLGECARRKLAKDVNALPDGVEAGLGTELLLRLADCKADVDVKLTKKPVQPKVSFDTLKRKGGKGVIESTLRCSRSSNDFAVALGEGQQVGNAGDVAFTFAEQGGEWRLPTTSGGLKTVVDLQVIGRAGELPGAEVYVDADDVKPGRVDPGQVFRTDEGGHVALKLTPTRPGTIRLCVLRRVGEEGVATWAAEIKVVNVKAGTIWKTILGRNIEVTETGRGRLVNEPSQRATGLAGLIEYIVSLFGNSSRTVAAQASGDGSVRFKAREVFRTGELGVMQVTMNGKLAGNPVPPELQAAPCVVRVGSTVAGVQCPTLVIKGKHALLGGSANGKPLAAFGHGNVFQKLVGNDGSTLVGNDGSTLVGNDGSTLVGNDGSTLVGNDGSTLVGNDGSTLIPLPGGNATAPTGPDALTLARAQAVLAGAAPLISNDGSTLVAAGGLN